MISIRILGWMNGLNANAVHTFSKKINVKFMANDNIMKKLSM